MTRNELLARHHELALLLMDAHRQLGGLLGTERDAKINGYMGGQGTDKSRENNGGIASIEITKEVFKVRAEIAALTEERDDVRLILAYTA
jgi:hypothetical protein